MNRGAWLIVVGAIANLAATLEAGVIFRGGYVESRAWSSLGSQPETVREHSDVANLPFAITSVIHSGQTGGEVDYDFRSSASGGAFGWNFALHHDGARESFALIEGELSFQVESEIGFAIAGSFATDGGGPKRAIFKLYDSPADTAPLVHLEHKITDTEAGVYDLSASGVLLPDVTYRLSYRFFVDNPAVGALGEASGKIELLIGATEVVTQPGDGDGNGRVDLSDLNLVRNNFGRLGESVPGDTAPFDGRVDLGDLNAVRNHFGQSLPTAVPEPGTSFLLAAGMIPLGWGAFRRRF